MTKRTRANWQWSLLGVAVGLAGMVFVGLTVRREWDAIVDAWNTAQAGWLTGSVIAGVLGLGWVGGRWIVMIGPRSARQALRWYFVGQLGKYVPGGVWPVVGRSELAVRGGAERRTSYRATVLSMAATYGAATVVGSAASVVAYSNWYRYLGVAVLVTSAATLVASATGHLPSRVRRRVPAERLAAEVMWHVPVWVLLGVSTWCAAHAVGAGLGVVEALAVTGVGWTIGFVVVGVPGGLGVREAVFIAMMSATLGVAGATAVAVLARLVAIVVDLVGAGASIVLGSRVPPTPNIGGHE